MKADCVVMDANIAFKTLTAQRGELRDRLGPSVTLNFYSPRFLFVELFKHKERLARPAKLTEDELLEAHRLCKDVDEADTPYVALTLHLDGRLWSEDKELKNRLRARGFDRFFEP